MKSAFRKAGRFAATGSKLAMALAFVSVVGGLSMSPALAREDDGRNWDRDHRRHEWRGERYDGYRHEYRRPYYYSQPVYVPPPVYYEPRRSPGINLFLPLDLRRR